MTVHTTLQPMPELAPMLKRLRLSGLLESLPERNRQAIAGKMSHTDFVALLIQDEVERREHKKFNLRLRRAGFRGQKTFEEFDFAFNPHIGRPKTPDRAPCRFVEERVARRAAGPCALRLWPTSPRRGEEAARRGYDVT